MATGKSENIVFGYAVQVDAVTPATGVFTAIKKRDASLTTTTATIESGETSSGRLADAAAPGRQTHAGTFNFNWRELDADIFMLSAMAGAWVDNAGTDVLEIASAPTYITIVEFIPWLAVGSQYTVYTGFLVGSMGMTFPQDGYIQMSVELSGGSKAPSATAPWTSLDDTSVKQSIQTCNANLSIQVATKAADALVETTSFLPSIDFNITNSLTELFDVRSCGPVESSLGSAVITGNNNAYLDDTSRLWLVDSEAGEQAKVRIEWEAETLKYRLDIPHATNTSVKDSGNADATGLNMNWGSVNGSSNPSLQKEPK